MTTKITEQNISNLANAGVDWQAVKTGNFTAVAGEGYFINTTSAAITVTLPASPSVGDIVVLKDYARTWATNNVTIASDLTDGDTSENTFSTNGQTVTLVYMDGVKGWSLINEDTTTELVIPPAFIAATGGTVTTSGDFKIHTFTGDGCFVVSQLGNAPTIPTGGPTNVDYLVVAGGGGGGGSVGGAGGASGGGAGGYRTTFPSPGCNAGSFPISVTTYPITVGGGGTPGTSVPGPSAGNNAGNGSNSVFSTITSTGGGGGRGGPCSSQDGAPGGSGGGASGGSPAPRTGGSGNTPPVSPSQGNNGGNHTAPSSVFTGAGGGGAGGSGGDTVDNSTKPPPGPGAPNSITGSGVTYAAGGEGGDYAGRTGGAQGAANSGDGGGAASGPSTPGLPGGAGAKGVVIIRYKFQ